MLDTETPLGVPNAAEGLAQASPADRRKELGQYFTGLALGKLLAHLALEEGVCTVLDPMAGDGDLLEAAWQAAVERGLTTRRLDGMEIDEGVARACRERLRRLERVGLASKAKILAADAFHPSAPKALPERCYDLVIANPPYVRYQSSSGNGERARAIRAGLNAIVSDHVARPEELIWRCLVDGYSGLADLSVPAWILAAAMVRPSGCLALVVSSTWRSRDYADAVRYLMLRCFRVRCVVEDMQADWFANAQVRTHLIVAQRLSAAEIAEPISFKDERHPVWVRLAAEAGNGGSLVGAAFAGAQPERQFADWLRDGCLGARPGIEIGSFDLHRERTLLERRLRGRRWRQLLTSRAEVPTVAAGVPPSSAAIVPEALADLLPSGCSLRYLGEAGVAVGQGLRTGCNSFFYVAAQDAPGPRTTLVETSALFAARRFAVPNGALRPVLRSQAELRPFANGGVVTGRVLDLRRFVLPEDQDKAKAAKSAYARNGDALPRVMNAELAAHVRRAAVQHDGQGKSIPMLSAVRTNGRSSQGGRRTPRFWYMLPDFAPRHLPAAFVPRVNHLLPWAEANRDVPVLIDANFCTFWAQEKDWSGHALKALLNSVWCRAAMEALGTPLGGGALKLEATHLRNLPVPMLSSSDKAELDAAGQQLLGNQPSVQRHIDEIVLKALCAGLVEPPPIWELAAALEARAASLVQSRKRRRPAAQQAFA